MICTIRASPWASAPRWSHLSAVVEMPWHRRDKLLLLLTCSNTPALRGCSCGRSSVHHRPPGPRTQRSSSEENTSFAEALFVCPTRDRSGQTVLRRCRAGSVPALPAAPLCSRQARAEQDSPAVPGSPRALAGRGRAEPGGRSGVRAGTAPQPWGGAGTHFIKGDRASCSASPAERVGRVGQVKQDRGGQAGRSRQGTVMELLRTIAHPPGGGAAKCCEAAAGRGAGGESRRKKAEEPPHQQPHQHGHPAAEVSRIITDPTTGKRYCRGKVLGKVMAAASPVPCRVGCAQLALLGRGGLWAALSESGALRAAAATCPAPPGRARSDRAPCPHLAFGAGEPTGVSWMLHAGSGEREPPDRR